MHFSNHLGNVLVTVSDRKRAEGTEGSTASGYRAEVLFASDYYPFGMQMPGREFSLEEYRYGYQGSEKDNELAGEGNMYTTHFRALDTRIGRWLSVDPKVSELPWQSSYCSMDNNPLFYNDPVGDKVIYGRGDVDKKTKRRIKKQVKARIKSDLRFADQHKRYRGDRENDIIYSDKTNFIEADGKRTNISAETVFEAQQVTNVRQGGSTDLHVAWNTNTLTLPKEISFDTHATSIENGRSFDRLWSNLNSTSLLQDAITWLISDEDRILTLTANSVSRENSAHYYVPTDVNHIGGPGKGGTWDSIQQLREARIRIVLNHFRSSPMITRNDFKRIKIGVEKNQIASNVSFSGGIRSSENRIKRKTKKRTF
jgi:RHS repeat-associated protein